MHFTTNKNIIFPGRLIFLFDADIDDNLDQGKGYLVGRRADGVFFFTGELAYQGVSNIPITRDANGWNARGNPGFRLFSRLEEGDNGVNFAKQVSKYIC